MKKKRKIKRRRPLPKFQMKYEPTTLDHLGLKLYSTLPPVISELVSNAHDAEAELVEIEIPRGAVDSTSEVTVRDYGHGLSPQELQDEFLPVGRNRRGDDGAQFMSRNSKRRVTGRKGLGKLAVFGIAEEVDVCAVQSGYAVTLRINYLKIKEWTRRHAGEDFEPELISSGPTDLRDGLLITMRSLVRRSPIVEDDLRRGLARRLTLIRSGFCVKVNGKAIGPGDRYRRSDCDKEFSWSLSELPHSDKIRGCKLRGWIGFLAKSSQMDRGVDIYASGKSVELASNFEYAGTTGQFARAYLVGELHADSLDGTEDLASTSRTTVLWESDFGQALKEWGKHTLYWAFNKWAELKRKKKEKEIITVGEFDEWLKSRQPREQKIAETILKQLVNDPNLEPESARPLIEVVKSSVESLAFQDLVTSMEQETLNPAKLIQLFDEWRVIEAREHLKLADGRLEAVDQLESYMEADALEVEQMQKLFETHLWLIDSAWTEADGQATYTKLLRKHCPQPKNTPDEDLRIDILGIRSDRRVTVVELKRPGKLLSLDDLTQIGKYVDWLDDHIQGTGRDSPQHVDGLLLVGRHNPKVSRAVKRMAAADIRVETYSELHDRAKDVYKHVEKALEAQAPEYAKKRRRELNRRRRAAIAAGEAETKEIRAKRKKKAVKAGGKKKRSSK